ncbi:TonB-dependent receptor [Komagataeibacter swingsii]|uniref:TonB-dependent receptor n=1 Tax=Komagataeibacter swingsii TaxID=215220 RepID=UPI0038CFB9D5
MVAGAMFYGRCWLLTTFLLGTTGFVAVSHAQGVNGVNETTRGRHAAAARPPASSSGTAARGAHAVQATSAPEILQVSSGRSGGGGMMRQERASHSIQTVTRQFMDMRSPAGTPLDMVKNLPSLNVSTQDTSGMTGGSIESRSLNDGDMALLVDGAVVTSGTEYLQEDIDTENMDRIEVTPGTSAIDQPVTSAALGVMNVMTHTPSHKFGGLTDFSYGTNDMSRQFIRLESGDIGKTGLRSFFSFSHTHADNWIGAGASDKKHIDFGVQKDIGTDSYIKFFLSWNQERYGIYNYPTADQFYAKKHGTGTWGASSDPHSPNFWGNHQEGPWNEVFMTLPVHLRLTDQLHFDLVPYFAYGRGWSSSASGEAGSGLTYANGSAVSPSQLSVNYFDQRTPTTGATIKLTYDISRHNQMTFGYWYGYTQSRQWGPNSAVNQNGFSNDPDNLSTAYFQNGQRYYSANQQTGDQIHALFIQDTAKYFQDRLVVSAGFKFAMMNYWFDNYLTHQTMGSNSVVPLPRFSTSYTFNRHHQVYVNAQGDFRAPDPSNLTENTALPRNQYTIKEELGYRYNNRYIILDLSLFNYAITNRLLSVYNANNSYSTVNAGNQTARGFDIMLSTRPFHHFSPYASFEYLNAHQDSNVQYGTSYLPTKGKEAIMAPHVMANFGLTYDNRHFFANATVHYTGPQSVTLVGDERIPGYVTDTISLGYRFSPFLVAKSPTFRLNFTNLTGSMVRTGTTGVADNYHAVMLLNGQHIAGSSGAQFYVEPRFSMTGTISTSF